MVALLRAFLATVVVGVPVGGLAIIYGWGVRPVLTVAVLVWATVSLVLVLEKLLSSR